MNDDAAAGTTSGGAGRRGRHLAVVHTDADADTSPNAEVVDPAPMILAW